MSTSEATRLATLAALRIPRAGLGLGLVFLIGFVILGAVASRRTGPRKTTR